MKRGGTAVVVGGVESGVLAWGESERRGGDLDVVDEVEREPEHHGVELTVAFERQVHGLGLALLGRVLEVEVPGLDGRRQGDEGVRRELHGGGVRGREPVGVHGADVQAAHRVDSHLNRHDVNRRARREEDGVGEKKFLQSVPETWDDPRRQQAVVQHVVDAEVARDRHVPEHREVRRALVNNLDLIVAEPVVEQALLGGHGVVEPAVGGGDVVRAGSQRFHRDETRAASDVEHPGVLGVLAQPVHREGDGIGERGAPRGVLEVAKVSLGHLHVRLHRYVVVGVLDVIVVVRLERREEADGEHVPRVDVVQRRRVGQRGDTPGHLGGRGQREGLLAATRHQVREHRLRGLLHPAFALGVFRVHPETLLELKLGLPRVPQTHEREPPPGECLDVDGRDGDGVAVAPEPLVG